MSDKSHWNKFYKSKNIKIKTKKKVPSKHSEPMLTGVCLISD